MFSAHHFSKCLPLADLPNILFFQKFWDLVQNLQKIDIKKTVFSPKQERIKANKVKLRGKETKKAYYSYIFTHFGIKCTTLLTFFIVIHSCFL